MSLNDITERKKAEEAKAEITDRLQKLAEATFDGIIISDKRKIVEANKAYAKLFGYEVSEMIGMDTLDFVAPESKDLVSKNISSGYNRPYEVNAIKKDGTIFPVLACGIKSTYDGNPVRITAIHDITERKQAENQFRDQQAQLAHVSRLTTVGELSSSLAHELNQPLCAIATISEGCKRLILSGKTGGDDITEGIEEISTQAARAGQIIRRMGQFVSKHGPKLSTFDINTVISESISLIGVQARQANVNIQYECPEKSFAILADRIQLQQVLINLMQNGIDAMENTKSKQCKISISTSISKEGFIEIAIKDNGKGFSRADKEILFQPFFTTKSEGVGIGLSISRSIIEAHGGHISAESEPGIGSTFKLKLPLSEHDKTFNES